MSHLMSPWLWQDTIMKGVIFFFFRAHQRGEKSSLPFLHLRQKQWRDNKKGWEEYAHWLVFAMADFDGNGVWSKSEFRDIRYATTNYHRFQWDIHPLVYMLYVPFCPQLKSVKRLKICRVLKCQYPAVKIEEVLQTAISKEGRKISSCFKGIIWKWQGKVLE